ncbi:MAG: peptidylprolyl isomerase [Candidatus Undinarchaeales archaeon]|jgi:peptidyl-prolyl cis-trans isomerase C|nr:peptidylprolyl isomerase [Candidatus Undinarchaeales archaeon]MDP7493731.1 peptidylprolyl isomerase [Candidatus Undinarchaeales archaeon]
MVTQVRASHILVKNEDEAKKIKELIDNGKNFGELAKQNSTCPSGKKGGDLGWFKHGQMVRPFEKTAFNMKKGQVSEPVKTQFGWHIIKLVDTK